LTNNQNIIDLTSLSEDDRILINNQLQKILLSSYFKNAVQQKKFLQFVVGKAIVGEGTHLKQYIIAVEGLGYAETFDSDTNPAIRINAGRIRKKLEDYYKKEGNVDSLRITLPKGHYTPSFTKNLTPQKELVSESYSLAPKLAVMCYSDRTQNDESNRLVFHVTDTLSKELSRFILARIVISIPHGDKNDTLFAASEIRERFQADYMLVFCIQQLPKNEHLLLCRILDVESKEIIWSETYDIDSEVPFHKQQTIIGNITAAASDIQQGILYQHWVKKLMQDEPSIPEHFKALVYYRKYIDNLSVAALQKSVDVCQNFLQKNPSDVISNIILADLCRRNYVYTFTGPEISLELGRLCALRAINSKPDSHEAHYSLGQILFCLDEKVHALNEFKITRDLCQYHAYIEFGVGFHLFMMGEREQGMELINKVLSLSSNYPSWFNVIPFCDAYLKGNYERALEIALIIDAPILFSGAMVRCMTYVKLGNIEKAKIELQKALVNMPDLLEKGEQRLIRYFGSEETAQKFWQGIVIANESK
jgi:adenylate cyclase